MAGARRIGCQVYMDRRTIYDKPCEEAYITKIDNTCLVEEVYMFREEETHGSEDNEPLAEWAHIHRIRKPSSQSMRPYCQNSRVRKL
jgi:hypothetical protein